jgi:Na+-transporting methylmalonyl-CoA/oxaloacetate decarboxylase gamma subunit
VESPIAAALVITAIGMTLLFLALAFFYGLMALMTAVVKDRPAVRAPSTEQEEGPGEAVPAGHGADALLRAAAIAVAVARAEAEQGFNLVGIPAQEGTAAADLLSPWWALHHQRQLALHSDRRRVS